MTIELYGLLISRIIILYAIVESDRELLTQLSKEEFASALKKGLGRAWLYVARYKLDNVFDLVLDACLRNQNYDPQCESSRGAWLFEMFGDSPYYSKFREAILNELKTATDTWDLQQLCELVKEMAVRGDIIAHKVLKDFVFDRASYSAPDDWLGVDEWIELKGIDGLLELARIYGQRLISDPNDSPYEFIFSTDETEQHYREALLEYAQKDPAIKAYSEYIENERNLRDSRNSRDRALLKFLCRIHLPHSF
jgi:hypothetical protein